MAKQSNTKLGSYQKEILKADFESAKLDGVTLETHGRVTIAYKRMGNTVRIATSVASPNEKKIRRKVGQFYALCAWYEGNTIALPASYLVQFCYALDCMEYS